MASSGSTSWVIFSLRAERLISQGQRVTVLDDLSTGRAENLAALRGREGFEFVRGSVEEDSCNAPAVVWSGQDLAAARAMLALPDEDVTRIVGDGWERWIDPRVGTDELLAAFGIDPVGPFDEVVARPGNSC